MRFLYLSLMSFFLFSCGNSTTKPDAENVSDQPNNEVSVEAIEEIVEDTIQHKIFKNIPHFTGIIRTTGLLRADVKALGLTDGRFQLEGKTQKYFLDGVRAIEKNVGKCARVWGEIVRESGADSKVFDYERSTIKAVDVQLVEEKFCSCEIKPSKNEIMKTVKEVYGPDKEAVNLMGKIKRNKRPAPDVAYDYVLNLDNSFIDKQDPSGKPTKVENIVILPTDYSMLRSFEINCLTQSVVVLKGYKLGGFVESTVFHVMEMN